MSKEKTEVSKLEKDISIFIPGPLPVLFPQVPDMEVNIEADPFLTFNFTSESGAMEFKKGYVREGYSDDKAVQGTDSSKSIIPFIARDAGYTMIKNGMLEHEIWKPIFNNLFYYLIEKHKVWPVNTN